MQLKRGLSRDRKVQSMCKVLKVREYRFSGNGKHSDRHVGAAGVEAGGISREGPDMVFFYTRQRGLGFILKAAGHHKRL